MIKTHEVYYPVYSNKDKFIILITGGRSSGKALPLDELVLTPWGYKPIGHLVEGEYISSVGGGMQRVTELHPIEKRDYLRLYFDDGTSIKCSREHLWEVYVDGERSVVEAQSLCGGEKVRLVSADRYNDHPCAPVVSYGFRDGNPVMIKRSPTNTELDNYRERGRFVREFYYRGERYAYISFAHKYKTLVSVSEVGRCVGRCISVSDESGLFLTRNCTITHNSFQTGTFIERLSFELGETEEGKRVAHQILYTRYTMVSAEISVIPEFLDKVDADGTSKYFHKTKRDVVNVATGATIMFRGIHTSSGNQTAKLKSIHGLTTFVVDEAEEWTNEKEFDTIMLSIRQKGLQNRIIIMMNPTDSNHFIYQRYIKDTHKIVEFDGVPVQISTHPNVLHIHTTYLDNIEHCGEQFLKEVEIMKRDNPEKYAHIVMGQWADVAEGAVFKNWGVVDEMPLGLKNVAKGMDLGYTCFVGDTLIETSEGAKPIRDVKVGDMVLTRNGYKLVNASLARGVKRVICRRLCFGNEKIEITATEDHKFYVNKEWKEFSKLTKGDMLLWLNTKGNCINATQKASMLTISTESGKKMGNFIKKSFIVSFMKSFMVQFRQSTLYIMLMAIHSTMTRRICWQSLLKSIRTYIRTLRLSRMRNRQERCVLQKAIGQNEEKKLKNDSLLKNECVSYVEKSMSRQTRTKNFVQNNVLKSGKIPHMKTMLREFANIVARCLWGINTQSQNVALKNVQTNYRCLTEVINVSESEASVFDLSIEGEHEFFANGLLVHNCDPTACVKCGEMYTADGVDLYIDEQFYQTGMLVGDIIRELKGGSNPNDGHLFVYSESADPRMIDEIFLGGVIIYGVQKYAGSILAGIEKIKDYKHIYITKRSYNVQNEFRNYTWAKDAYGNFINQPIDAYNHACFVRGTMITTDQGEKEIADMRVGDMVMTSEGYRRVLNTFDNGIREVSDFTFLTEDGYVGVTATPDHKVWTEYGFEPIAEVEPYDVLTINGEEREVLEVWRENTRMERVYNIEVEDRHEYYANGLLVHNCDAIRYYILGKIMGKTLRREMRSPNSGGGKRKIDVSLL